MSNSNLQKRNLTTNVGNYLTCNRKKFTCQKDIKFCLKSQVLMTIYEFIFIVKQSETFNYSNL